MLRSRLTEERPLTAPSSRTSAVFKSSGVRHDEDIHLSFLDTKKVVGFPERMQAEDLNDYRVYEQVSAKGEVKHKHMALVDALLSPRRLII